MTVAMHRAVLAFGLLGLHCASGTPPGDAATTDLDVRDKPLVDASTPDDAATNLDASSADAPDTHPIDAPTLDAPASDARPIDAPPPIDRPLAVDVPADLPRPPVDVAVPDAGDSDAGSFVPVVGVHVPRTVDPVVDIQHNHWLLDAYRVVLGREHDPAGYRVNYAALQSTSSREDIVAAFVASAEFRANPSLAGREGFVTRLYRTLLRREPSAPEVASQVAQLRAADGSGAGITWEQMIEAFYASAEFRSRCETGYYTLGAPVRPGALLLGDLFAGRARLQTIAESQAVTLAMPSALAIWDQKVSVLRNPQGTGYLGFTRAYVASMPERFTVMMLSSPDAVHFTEVGPVFERSGAQTWYDPHVAVDHGVCPPRYVMAMECLGREAASLCVSESTTPGWTETWSRPAVTVDGCNGAGASSVCGSRAAQSASTGVTLTDGRARYVAWTQVYDGVMANDPLAHTYSQSTAVDAFAAHQGTVMRASHPIATMMSATPMPWCASPWDCNNRDKQDWKREGDFFYALYNGANYYRCDGAWGVSVARSAEAAGPEYTDRLPLAAGIAAERNDTCGISYPMLNVVDGELYVYYAYYPRSGGNRTMRARLVATP